MIKHSNKLSFILLAATLLFASCSEIVNGGTVGDGSTTDTVLMGVGASIEDENGVKNSTFGASSERTLIPTVFDKDDLKFTIYGISSRGLEIEEREIGKDNNWDITLNRAAWTLTMKAYSDDAKTKLVYIGHKFVDVTNGTGVTGTTIEFTLNTKGISTDGGVKLKQPFDQVVEGTTKLSKVTAGLYNSETGALVTGTSVDYTGAALDPTAGGDSEFEYEKTVAPGTYIFEISYFTGTSPNFVEVGTFSEWVVVSPGNITEYVFAKFDNYNKKPAAPENLKVWYVNNSAKGSKYDVHLTWEDKSDNEKYFVLYLYEFENFGDTDLPEPFVITPDVLLNTKDYSYYTGRGSLQCSSQTVDITLDTSKLYDIKIASRGAMGELDTKCTRVAAGTLSDHTAFGAPSGTEYITLTRISYSMSSNTSVQIDDGTPAVYNNSYFINDYGSYKGTAIDLIDGSGTNKYRDQKKYKITNSGNPFTKWLLSDKTPVTTYDDFKDLTVYASFNKAYTINPTIEGLVDIDKSRINVSYVDKNGASVKVVEAGVVKEDTLDVGGIVGGSNITFTVDTGTVVYEEVSVYLNNEFMGSSTTNSVTVNTTTCDYKADQGLDSGYYTVNIVAYDYDINQKFSYTFTFYLKR